MGNRMAKSNVERSNHERSGMEPETRLFRRPRSQRLMRGVACWLALQTALAAPLASAAEVAAAAMSGASASQAGQAAAAQGAPAARVGSPSARASSHAANATSYCAWRRLADDARSAL